MGMKLEGAHQAEWSLDRGGAPGEVFVTGRKVRRARVQIEIVHGDIPRAVSDRVGEAERVALTWFSAAIQEGWSHGL